MKWYDLINTCGTPQTLKRALSAQFRGTVYKLGKGGFNPTKPLTSQCDCSGFIAWAIGIPRELPPGSNKWLSTNEYWAGGKPVKAGLFSQIPIEEATVGNLLVYPDKGGNQGHIALIVDADDWRIIHCSNGNYENFRDAIQISSPDIFLYGNHNSRAMAINYDVLKRMVTHDILGKNIV